MKDKEGYYKVMEMDMKTGRSKFLRYEKITFEDNLYSFFTMHQFILILFIVFCLLFTIFYIDIKVKILSGLCAILGIYMKIKYTGIID